MMLAFRFCNCGTRVSSGHNLLISRTFQLSTQQHASVSNKTLKLLGLPVPPKKPKNPFIRFALREKSRILEDSSSPKRFIEQAALKWNNYDPRLKKELEEEYASEMQVYSSDLEKYKNSITPEQINIIRSIKKKETTIDIRARNKNLRSLGKPKKPLSSFLKFLLEKKAQKYDNSIKYTEWIKDVAKEWENMSESDKAIYKDETKSEMAKYRSDVLEWEEKMIKQGNIDMIKDRSLLKNNKSEETSNQSTTTS